MALSLPGFDEWCCILAHYNNNFQTVKRSPLRGGNILGMLYSKIQLIIILKMSELGCLIFVPLFLETHPLQLQDCALQLNAFVSPRTSCTVWNPRPKQLLFAFDVWQHWFRHFELLCLRAASQQLTFLAKVHIFNPTHFSVPYHSIVRMHGLVESVLDYCVQNLLYAVNVRLVRCTCALNFLLLATLAVMGKVFSGYRRKDRGNESGSNRTRSSGKN
jgi:hypothetical protein